MHSKNPDQSKWKIRNKQLLYRALKAKFKIEIRLLNLGRENNINEKIVRLIKKKQIIPW